MSRLVFVTLAVLYGADAALAQVPIDRSNTDSASPVMVAAAPSHVDLGGGFIEFLFSGAAHTMRPPPPQPAATPYRERSSSVTSNDAMLDRSWRGEIDPKFLRQEVPYHGKEKAGTIVIDTPNHFLY